MIFVCYNATTMAKQKNPKQFYKHKISNVLNVQKIVTVHYQEPEKSYQSKEESHDFWEIIYSDRNEITVVKDGVSSQLQQGEIIFIKPNQPHYVICADEDINIFILSFDCRSESMAYFNDRQCVVPETYRYLLQNIMTEASETFHIPQFDPDLKKLELKEHPNLGGEQVLKNSLELLLIYLLRQATNQTSSQEFFISKITSSGALQDEIVCMLSSKLYEKLTLDELCKKFHYGKTYLCTFFKEKTGMSIHQTYLKLKVDEAKKLIRKKMSFTSIANKLYFDSASHFNYVFKKYTGMTPGEYKNSIT